MANTFHTVSEEMARTDWAGSHDRTPLATQQGSRSMIGLVAALIVAGALLAGIIYLVPPTVY